MCRENERMKPSKNLHPFSLWLHGTSGKQRLEGSMIAKQRPLRCRQFTIKPTFLVYSIWFLKDYNHCIAPPDPALRGSAGSVILH